MTFDLLLASSVYVGIALPRTLVARKLATSYWIIRDFHFFSTSRRDRCLNLFTVSTLGDQDAPIECQFDELDLFSIVQLHE